MAALTGRLLLLPLLLLLLTARARSAGEYCDDFEGGDFGTFWSQGALNTGGEWKPSSYRELLQSIPDFPAPASGDTLVYLTPAASGYMSAQLQMTTAYRFPEGSSLSFRYWLRSQWLGSGTLEVHRLIGSMDEAQPILSLTEYSGPSNSDWMVANVTVPPHSETFKVSAFTTYTYDGLFIQSESVTQSEHSSESVNNDKKQIIFVFSGVCPSPITTYRYCWLLSDLSLTDVIPNS